LNENGLISKLNISFAEFLARNPAVSTRLSNLVLRGMDDAYPPLPTVLEYWENREAAYWRIHFIDGLGKKSIAELDRVILDYLRRHAGTDGGQQSG